MSARELLAALASEGVSVAAEGDALVVRPGSRLTDDMRLRLRAAKGELLALLSGRPVPVSGVSLVSSPAFERETPTAREGAEISPTLKKASAPDPAWWRELFEERAAIREHDGGLRRPDAEGGALADCIAHWRALNPLPPSSD